MKMVSFMRVVEAEAKEKDVWIKKVGNWDYTSTTHMWDAIKDDFTRKYCQTRRKKELSWCTVYNNMSKANVFANKRNKANK